MLWGGGAGEQGGGGGSLRLPASCLTGFRGRPLPPGANHPVTKADEGGDDDGYRKKVLC